MKIKLFTLLSVLGLLSCSDPKDKYMDKDVSFQSEVFKCDTLPNGLSYTIQGKVFYVEDSIYHGADISINEIVYPGTVIDSFYRKFNLNKSEVVKVNFKEKKLWNSKSSEIKY